MRDLLRFAVGLARDTAADHMLDTCRVFDEPTRQRNPETGRVELVYGDPVYEGPCKVRAPGAQERLVEVAGAAETIQRYTVDVPVGSFRPATGQVVEIVAAALDPHLTGRWFQVTAPQHKTAGKAYRLTVEAM